MEVVLRGHLHFYFKDSTLKNGWGGTKKYSKKAQKANAMNAIGKLKRQERQGKITNLNIKMSDDNCFIEYDIPRK